MNIAFYTASCGVKYMQKSMDVIANNMANVSTPGFKTSVSSFSDLLYTNIHRGGGDSTKLMVGHGVKLGRTGIVMSQGDMMPTDRELDFGLVGEGFYAVENENGERFYTRAGNFYIKLDSETGYLTTAEGDYVLNLDGDRIELTAPEGSTTLDISGLRDTIGVYQFANKYALNQVGSNKYEATTQAGEPTAAVGDYTIMQGMLESSKTDMAKEMVDVITTQRAFQLNARMVQMADEVESMVNTLR